MRFTFFCGDGKLPDYIQKQLTEFCLMNMGKAITINLRKGKIRSNRQNAYYFGVVVPVIVQMMYDYGYEDADAKMAHEMLKVDIMGMSKKVDLFGVPITITTSTAQLTTAEFEEKMELVRKFAAENGYTIPLPNEVGFTF